VRIVDNNTNNEQEKNTWEKVKEFINDNKYYFIGGGVILVILNI
jgi:hypothetical protein